MNSTTSTIKSLMEVFAVAQKAVAQGATDEQIMKDVPAEWQAIVKSMVASLRS